MSGLQFYSYNGVGKNNEIHFRYSQAVRIGDRIECSGQGRLGERVALSVGYNADTLVGGWDPSKSSATCPREINAQIDQAFENVDLALKTAGGKGWEQVYKVRSYHVPINGEALEAMVRNFKKWMPNHAPLWTCVGVPRLGEDDMRVEIEVEAHDPK